MSIVNAFLICRSRNASTPGSSLGPSTPQFHDMLSSTPSLFPSPFSRLCFSLYDTVSFSVKPSWQLMKLMLLIGRCPDDS